MNDNFFERKILLGKLNADDIQYPYFVTPPIDDDGWTEAVEEARGYGISIASFGDTSDKIVLHPGHLGYKFNYYWGNGSWGDSPCFYEEDIDIIFEANNILISIGIGLIQKGYRIEFCSPSGTVKGYLSTKFFDFTIDDLDNLDELNVDFSKDFVLFVYGMSLSNIEHLAQLNNF